MADILSASFHPVELVSRQASVQDIGTPPQPQGGYTFLIYYYVLYFARAQYLNFFWPAVTSPYNSNCLKAL